MLEWIKTFSNSLSNWKFQCSWSSRAMDWNGQLRPYNAVGLTSSHWVLLLFVSNGGTYPGQIIICQISSKAPENVRQTVSAICLFVVCCQIATVLRLSLLVVSICRLLDSPCGHRAHCPRGAVPTCGEWSKWLAGKCAFVLSPAGERSLATGSLLLETC